MSRSKPLLEAPELRGRAFALAHAAATDQWFKTVAQQRIDNLSDMALLAVGGYGRGELSPYSDVDVVLVHRDGADGADLAEALWYPAWDRGLALGYVVVTVPQAEALLVEEFEWATAFLDTRLIVGNADLKRQVDQLTATLWWERRIELMDRLGQSVAARHEERGDAASQIEPNLKEGRGGLRDVHALGWASRATPGFADEFLVDLDQEVDLLLEARVALHRHEGRPGDVLTLDNQDAIAEALGQASSGELMRELARAARRIAWCSDEAWSRWDRQRAVERGGDDRVLTIELDGSDQADAVASNPLLPLQMAEKAAREDLVMNRSNLELFQRHWAGIPEPWPAEARRLFAGLLLAGRPAVRVIEDLDHFGLMERLIPEWAYVQCKPQRNVLHTFTVDRHLCEAAVNAAALVDRVDRPDLLVVGSLFHDIGKGFPGDHTEVGRKVIAEVTERMGYSPDDVAVLVDLCRHHLLLPDIATRRDLSDPGTIRAVAAAVDSLEFLDLLAALTEADSKATGPSAWGSWKEGLLKDLVSRTAHVLDGGDVEELANDEFPTERVRQLMASGERHLSGVETRFTVVDHDRIGLFSALAGALAVCGLEVVDAMSYSDPVSDRAKNPMAAYELNLQTPQSGAVDWEPVLDLVNRALDGKLALRARVTRRAQNHARYQRRLSATPPRRTVVVDNDISDWATVVEVHAADQIGLLYYLTQVMQELQLDIRMAKIQTFGPQAVDSFYVTLADGSKVTAPDLLAEMKLALGEVIGI